MTVHPGSARPDHGHRTEMPIQTPLTLKPLPDRPLVSILVANYNYERFIERALESALLQTYRDLEIIVCDDGSSDSSPEMISAFEERDPRVKLIRKANGGAASALNAAYQAAGGEVICILDADDVFHPTKVERVVSSFTQHEWGLLVHALTLIDSDGNHIQRKPAFGYFEAGWLAEKVRSRGGRWAYLEASSVCLRREVADAAFPIPSERMKTWADAFICVLGALVAPVGFIDEALAEYRIHGTNVSGSNSLSHARSLRAMDGFERLIAGVNERMTELDSTFPPMDVSRNLVYRESCLFARLFDPASSARERLRSFAAYLQLLVRDDIYSGPRKILSFFFPATALLLPVRARERWVTAGLTHSSVKDRVASALRSLPGVSRGPAAG